MADKQISSLPQAQTVDDASLFVLEQQGTAMKATGAQWKGYAIQAVSQYVAPAQQAAQQAQQAAQQATQAVSQIGTAVEDTKANAQAAQEAQEAAEAAQGKAEDAQEAIENLSVSAETLPPDQEATVEKTVSPDGVVSLAFGIPQGDTGTGLDILGTYASLEELQGAVQSPSQGDMYNVGTIAPYTIYMWDTTDGAGAWESQGQLQGPRGEQGPQGDPGEPGAKGDTGPRGPAGSAATINGVNALTLNATGGINGRQSGSTYTIDGSGKANKPTRLTVTLSASGWASNSQTVTVQGVVADETAQLIMPVPALASQTAYYEAGILVTGQAANSLTFTCQNEPTEDLTVYVVMQEVGV